MEQDLRAIVAKVAETSPDFPVTRTPSRRAWGSIPCAPSRSCSRSRRFLASPSPRTSTPRCAPSRTCWSCRGAQGKVIPCPGASVVTGCGVVTAAGIELDGFWQSLVDGACFIKPLAGVLLPGPAEHGGGRGRAATGGRAAGRRSTPTPPRPLRPAGARGRPPGDPSCGPSRRRAGAGGRGDGDDDGRRAPGRRSERALERGRSGRRGRRVRQGGPATTASRRSSRASWASGGRFAQRDRLQLGQRRGGVGLRPRRVGRRRHRARRRRRHLTRLIYCGFPRMSALSRRHPPPLRHPPRRRVVR